MSAVTQGVIKAKVLKKYGISKQNIISAVTQGIIKAKETINKKILTTKEAITAAISGGKSRKELKNEGFSEAVLTSLEVFPKDNRKYQAYPVIYLTAKKAKELLIYQQLFKTPTGSKMFHTPHHSFVVKTLSDPSKIPAATNYAKFIKDYEGSRDHSPKKYFDNIKQWQKNGFNTEQHPIQIYKKQLNGKLYYGVYNGAHRAAYAIATGQGLKLYVTTQSPWEKIWYRKPMAKKLTAIHPFDFNRLARNGYNDKTAWN